MKDYLRELIKNALNKFGIEKNLEEIAIEIPNNKEHGDYSSNVALKEANKVGMNAREFASKLANEITDSNITKIEVAGPGFINFYLKVDYLFDNLNTIITDNEYGKSNM